MPISDSPRISTETILCHDCRREFPLNEYFNHKDGLRNVPYGKRTLTVVQRLVLVPLMELIIWMVLNIFYREVVVVGLENVPKEGPVVFYGNHQNQFVDAAILWSRCGRQVRFIIAEKSMHRPIIGFFARLMNCVPVTRPEDVSATKGSGTITVQGNIVTGTGTNFSSIRAGDVILLKRFVNGETHNEKMQVQAIISDTVLTTTQGLTDDQTPQPVEYHVSPRIDNSEMYAEVYGTLRNGKAIGIFPEGGSHDRPSLLPLKSGVALFGLGSAERGLAPTIVPFGLTYFKGHRFRSVAHIEFSPPVPVPNELVERFAKDKREATKEFLDVLDSALRGVTVNAPDWDTIAFIHAFRKLFQPTNVVLPAKQYLDLFKRISRLVQQNQEHEALNSFRLNVERYMDKCSSLFVRDSQVSTLKNIEKRRTVRLLVRRLVLLFVIGFLLLPAMFIGVPVAYVTAKTANKHAQSAKAASKVKLFGKDVQASYKLIIGFVLFPTVNIFLSLVALIYDGPSTALTVFCCTPLVLYVSLHVGREWIMEFRAALPLFLSILSNHKQFRPLYDLRQSLVHQARKLVVELDPKLSHEVVGWTTDRPSESASLFSMRHISRNDREHLLRKDSLADLFTLQGER